jgi:tRNA (guanine-N7-)-methyltransferase
MGRRALPKIDPDIDLSNHFFELENVAQPLNTLELFGRDGPLEVEVGSGKGLFLQSQSEKQPEVNFLGVELSFKYSRFAAMRAAKAKRDNVRMICGDGIRFFAEWLQPQSVSAVHVYFPDPWWKDRHRKRRVMRKDFVQRIETVLQVGGSLHFWTDVKSYFDEALELLAAKTTLEGPFEVEANEPEHTLDYRTHFERRTRLNDMPVYRSRFERTNGAD